MSQKNVLHIIETLDRGGAELLFVGYINALPSIYQNHVVVLREQTTIKSELSNYKSLHVLNCRSKLDLATASFKIKQLIIANNIQLVHAHLYWPTIVSRLATPKHIPLLFSVHNLITHDAFNLNRLSKYLEKLTYSRAHTGVFVSEAVLDDYKSQIKVGKKNHVVYNFVNQCFFEDSNSKSTFTDGALHMVSVGNLRSQKNYKFLLKVFAQIRHLPVTLTIYGDGPQRQELEEFILTENLVNIKLMGSLAHPEQVLRKYDLFVSSSMYEGFYIAMAEAMAVGLPCLLPDLKVLKEVSGGTQLYYKQGDTEDFRKQIELLLANNKLMEVHAAKAKRVAKNYTVSKHISKLSQIYSSVLK